MFLTAFDKKRVQEKKTQPPREAPFLFSALAMDDDQTGESPAACPKHGVGEDVDPTTEDGSSSTLLDLSSYQLHDLYSVELPSSLTELDLTANRLSSLDPRIENLSNLKKLSFRQNLIDDAAVEPISGWQALSGLEVFDVCLLPSAIFFWLCL